MRIFVPLLILTFGLFSFSCLKSETFTKPNTLPILEISEDARGNWEVPGKTLFLRLYDNGFVEFEHPSKVKEANSQIQTKINGDELHKITTLLYSEDFQKTQNNYKRQCCCTDATLDFRINFQISNEQKIINLNDYCGLQEIKNPQTRCNSDFPKVLSELMILIDNIRWKYIPRQKSSNLIQQKLK